MDPSTIGDRIRQMRKQLKLTQQDLARRMQGVSHVAISQWESNTTKPNAENLYELSVLFGCDFRWLLLGTGTNVSVTSIDNDRIPVLDYDFLKTWDSTQPLSIDEEAEYIMTNAITSKYTFALKIVGDSMEPDFFPGDIIVVDASLKPAPGEFIIAKCSEGILFRRFKQAVKEDGEEYFILIPSNHNYAEVSSLSFDLQIIGTMIEHRIFRRKR